MAELNKLKEEGKRKMMEDGGWVRLDWACVGLLLLFFFSPLSFFCNFTQILVLIEANYLSFSKFGLNNFRHQP